MDKKAILCQRNEPVNVELVNIRMILALAVKCCSKSPRITLLCRAESSGNWCKVLFVAAEETLEPEYGLSSNVTEPGDKVESSFVLLSESSDTLAEIDKPRGRS